MDILQSCKELYITLQKQLNSLEEYTNISEFITTLFKLANGRVYIKSQSPTYISYEGYIEMYSIGGSVSKNSYKTDLNRLIEDITMGKYRSLGGNKYNYTPDFIRLIKKYE